MQTIHAWIYNPDNALFKGQSKRAALITLRCQAPEKCELYTNCNSCLLQGALTGCKFGQKSTSDGYTKRARKYYDWMSETRESNKEHFDQLSNGTTYGGIFKAQDYWCLPYAYMSGSKSEKFPLESRWVHEDDMTSELLDSICLAEPRALFNYTPIKKYQSDTVPRFLHDIKTRYPDLFELLPESQKLRSEELSFVGRKADIKTCAPGRYTFARNSWTWDGEKLTRDSMLFPPVKGKVNVEVVPEDGQSVEITDDSQVTSETVFLD